MTKKGGQVQLQLEIDTEEDWTSLIQKEGLIVVDIYSDWCGPCSGMVGNLRKLKLELGGDMLILAVAKADHIECLARFRGKSEPTWMFISGRKMIRLMFGANAPRLINIITEEIANERKAIESRTPREGINFQELTEEEQKRVDKENQVREEAERIEREAREKAINERREDIVDNLFDYLKEYNFVLLWPHITNEYLSEVYAAIKETTLMVAAGKPTQVILTDENIYEMLFYSTWSYNEHALNDLKSGAVHPLLFQTPMDYEGDVVEAVLRKVYGEIMEPPGDEDSLAKKLSKTKQIETYPDDEDLVEIEEQDIENKKDDKNEDIMEKDMSPTIIEYELPGIYVPQNEKAKIIAMKILFPQITQKYDLPEPDPIPPHLIIAFDAFKRHEILQLETEYPGDTMHIGYFTSHDPETAILIAKTTEHFDTIPTPPIEAKLVVQVSKKNDEPLLSYVMFGPTYLSPNSVVGEKEGLIFFPDSYEEPEPEKLEEEKKKKKKRARGAPRTTNTNVSGSSKMSGESLGIEENEGALDSINEIGELDDSAAANEAEFNILEEFTEPLDTEDLETQRTIGDMPSSAVLDTPISDAPELSEVPSSDRSEPDPTEADKATSPLVDDKEDS